MRFQKELSLILDYIEQLKKVDVSKVDLKKGLIKSHSVTRKDEQIKKPIEEISELMNLMPERKNNYLKTKKIL